MKDLIKFILNIFDFLLNKNIINFIKLNKNNKLQILICWIS